MSHKEEIQVLIDPPMEEAESFKDDLLWLRSSLEEKSKRLIGLNGQKFKLEVYRIIFEIWSEGQEKKVFNSQVPPSFHTHPETHSFEVTYYFEIPFEAHCKINLKKQLSIWRIFHS